MEGDAKRFATLYSRLLIFGTAAAMCVAAAPARAAFVKDISTGIDPLTRAKVVDGQGQSFYVIAPGDTGGG